MTPPVEPLDFYNTFSNRCQRATNLNIMIWVSGVFRTWLYILLGFIASPNIKIYHHLQRDYLLSSINNRTLGFEKIFTLNLPSRSDRRDALALMSSLSAFDITFVPGVARHELSPREIPDNVSQPISRIIST
jgi:hypothetical protein